MLKRGTKMGVLSKLRGKQTTALATVQAPSADLIRDDGELVVPEPEDIVLKITDQELDEYIKLAEQSGHSNKSLSGLWMLQILKRTGCRRYNHTATNTILNKQAENLSRKYGHISWRWRNLKECGPIPPRVLRKIVNILEAAGADKKERLLLNASQTIDDAGNYQLGNDGVICFLTVDIIKGGAWSEFGSIIDAWRGPTFSDEDSYLPGQERI
ncbi:MAG: hypothetical protein HYT62_01650 [Candidatus Yanofskybacteria bacterium]|nr:hypothetical protein [Candidatus Yanofskybacteria bacterium]